MKKTLISLFDTYPIMNRFFSKFPETKAYLLYTKTRVTQMDDTDLSPCTPVYDNRPVLRPDGRVCIVRSVGGDLARESYWVTWCDERVDQPGWDKTRWVPTCVACVANKEE